MIGTVGQSDLWAQLAALRAAQAATASAQGGISSFGTATTSATGNAADGVGANGTSPLLSDGLMSQLPPFSSVPGDAAGGSVSNLLASLQSLLANLGGGSATTGSTETTGTTGSDSTAASSTSGTGATSDLSRALLRDLQSIAADLSGDRTAASATGNCGQPDVSASNAQTNVTQSDGTVSNGSTVSSGGTNSAEAGTTSASANTPDANEVLIQQIAQAVAAYMQAAAGQSSTLGSSTTDVAA